MTMNFEICTESIEGAMIAQKYKIKRIELCSALSVGGLTPSIGLISNCVKNTAVEVHVLIRPRPGNFEYNSDEIAIMKTDIFEAKRVGASGVVFGVLKADLTLSEFNKELVAYAKSLNLEVTFHRAFDFIKDYKKGVEQIIELGFDRLLTAGLQKTAEEGLEVINYLQANYGKQIQIMAGSGVNSLNALKMASSGINNLHFSAHKTLNTNELFSMGAQHVIDEQKIKTITMLF